MIVRNTHNPHLLRRTLTRVIVNRTSAAKYQVDQYGILHYETCNINKDWQPVSRSLWWSLIIIRLTATIYNHFGFGKKDWYITNLGLFVWFIHNVALASGIVIPRIHKTVENAIHCHQKYGTC